MEWMMTVGQISKLFNITSESLRHYDRIDLLKPMIDENNGYRYYSIKEMEKLDLILDAKYLEIPLSNIKEAISNDSVEDYIELIELQEKTIDEKINHLLKIKEQAKEKKTILKEMMNFKNNYNFEELEIVNEDNTIIFIPIADIVQGKINQKDSSKKSMYLEAWMVMYKGKYKNTLVEDKIYMGIYENKSENLMIDENIKVHKSNYKGKVIKTKFVGNFDEIEEYIVSIMKYFYNDEKLDIDIGVAFIWTVYNEISSINFVEITIPLVV